MIIRWEAYKRERFEMSISVLWLDGSEMLMLLLMLLM
jgi:hypothetical protein